MLSVDVVYESEILPRLVLLKQHMQTLQIDLMLHARLPAKHSPRVVYAPRATSSELHEAIDKDCESIALYFFNPPSTASALPTDLTVALPTWPARSSDQAVAEFARYLHRSIATQSKEASPGKAPDKRGVRSVVRNIDWTGVRNLVILIGMIIAASWMIGQIPADKQSPEPEIATLPDAILPAPTVSRSAPPKAAVAIPQDAIMSDQPLAPARLDTALEVAPPRANACGGSSEEVLQAVLTLQAPTDFTRCLKHRQLLNKGLADTN